MGLFDFLKHKKTETIVYRLVWFELQIAPSSYRFAIIPEQPILIGFEGESGEKGATMLIRYEHVPDLYEKIVEKVDNLVKKNRILSITPVNSVNSFSDNLIEKPSVHIRLAYADNTLWASFYELSNVPNEIDALIQDTKSLAKQIMKEQTQETISGDAAQAYIEPAQNTAQKESPSIIVKVKVHHSGKISANKNEVSLSELGSILDELKIRNGDVWYYRESPDIEPSESTVKTIQKVLDAVTSRELSIRLQAEEY